MGEEKFCFELLREGKRERVKLGEDAMFSMRVDSAESVEAPAVFVGYGLSVPEMDYDDLAGLDLRGKIAVYLAGGPGSIPGPLKAHYQSAAERWKALQKAGAVGTAVVFNPQAMDIPWPRASLARFLPQMELADPVMRQTSGAKIWVQINPDRADIFFQGTGHRRAGIP